MAETKTPKPATTKIKSVPTSTKAMEKLLTEISNKLSTICYFTNPGGYHNHQVMNKTTIECTFKDIEDINTDDEDNEICNFRMPQNLVPEEGEIFNMRQFKPMGDYIFRDGQDKPIDNSNSEYRVVKRVLQAYQEHEFMEDDEDFCCNLFEYYIYVQPINVTRNILVEKTMVN